MAKLLHAETTPCSRAPLCLKVLCIYIYIYIYIYVYIYIYSVGTVVGMWDLN